MKIERDRTTGLWVLTSGSHVLYSGRRSPWDSPRILREAVRRERSLAGERRERSPDDAIAPH